MAASISDSFPTECALLGFFRQGPRHGYDLYQELSDPAGLWLVWRMKQSQLYALLARLEEHGYLTSSMEPQEGRPPRKMYRLTPAGGETFQAWVRAPVERGRQVRVNLLTKLFFARREGPEAAQHLLDAQRAACQAWLDALQAETEATTEKDSFQRLVHQYRTGQVQAMIDWLQVCQEAPGLIEATS